MAEIHDPREATLVVAASDSLTKSADYRCDGTADEVQIQAAIDALPAGGGRVLLLDGTFTIAADGRVNITSDTVLEGQGNFTIIEKAASPTELNMLYFVGTTGSHLENIAIKNIKFNTNNPTEDLFVVRAYYTDGVIIENIEIVSGDNKKGRLYGAHCTNIKLLNSIFDSIYHVQFHGLVDEGDDATIDCYDVLVQGCAFRNNAAGSFALGNIAERWKIIGNEFTDCGLSGVDISYSPDSVVTGNAFDTIGAHAIYSEGGRKLVISDNVIVDANVGIELRNQLGIGADVPGKVIVSNNEIYNSTTHGIHVLGVGRVIIDANQIVSCGGYGIFLNKLNISETDYFSDNCMIIGNYIFDFGKVTAFSRGIGLLVADYTLVRDNVIDGDDNAEANACIMEATDADHNDIRGNVLKSATAAIHAGYHGPLTTIGDDNEGIRITDVQMFQYVKNTSGGELAAGDVCIIKKVAAGNEINTTTVEGDQLVFGMVAETIANNAWGHVQVKGYTTLLKVDGTADIAIGDLIGTFTTAPFGMKAAAGKMAFAIALEAYATDDSAGVINALIISPRQAI